MKYSYNWLKWYVPEAPDKDKLADIITRHLFEVEGIEEKENGDSIFDIKILPNRAHDLLSHQGLAREIAAQLGIKYTDPSEKYKVPNSSPSKLEINIDTGKCRRYMGRIIRNVKTAESPEWVRNHLNSIGQRSINNVVDATNLVMYDSGQPTHAFDLDKIKGEKLIIRQAENGEKMTTLDDIELELSSEDMVIADEEKVLALAGVKGGKAAQVDESTKNILIEVANFDPISVRKTAKRANVFTDSSKRFENDLSPTLTDLGMLELSGIFAEYGFEDFEEIVDTYPDKSEKRKVKFRLSKVSKILGREITSTEVEDVLKRYGFIFEREEDEYMVIAPYLRLDIENEEDIAEEVGRVLGYDLVTPVIPKIDFKPKVNETFRKLAFVREKLLNKGYSEVMTYTFQDKGEVEVLASASDKKFLRNNLTDGLEASLKFNTLNAPYLEMKEVKIFEIGTVFQKNREETRVAYGEKNKITEVTLDEFCKGMVVADIKRIESKETEEKKLFAEWSIFPFIARDVAVWVPEQEGAENLENMLKEEGTELLVRAPYLFDSFSKNGRTSYAFRLIFQSGDRTLTDEEVNNIMEKISLKIKANSLWELR